MSECDNDSRCTDCMVGQGDDCHCREPVDGRALRWLLVALVCFWGLLAWGVKILVEAAP